MRNLLGYLLWLVAIVITVVVVLAKYHIYQTPTLAGLLEKDEGLSLLVAIAFSLVSKWV